MPSSASRRSAARHLATPAALVLAAALSGCAGDGVTPPPPPPPPRVATLVAERGVDTLVTLASSATALAVRAADGTPLPGRLVRAQVGDPSVVQVDSLLVSTAEGVQLRLVAGQPGRTEVTVRSDDAIATLTVVVVPVPLAELRYAADAGAGVDTLVTGDVLERVAVARDSVGRALDAAEYRARGGRYTSSDSAVARVDSLGRVTAVGAGRATIAATVGARAGGRDSLRVERLVVALPAVDTVQVTPGRLALLPGSATTLTAVLRDAAGAQLVPGTTGGVRWTSAHPAVAEVDALGRVTARAVGTTVVTVEAGWGQRMRRTEVAVSVSAPPPPPPFQFTVRYLTPLPESDRQVVAAALARWQRVIARNTPEVQVDLPANWCGAGTPALAERVAGLLLLIEVKPIDGVRGTLGSAGPCVVRQDARGLTTPVVGIITLDQEDVAQMRAAGTLNDVLAHEIGHTLGIGTLWDANEPAMVPEPRGLDPQYVAPAARVRAAQLGYVAAGATVPVEDQGGPGSVGAHWRESLFGTELMSSRIGAAGNPLSTVTVGALLDLGYQTQDAGAEPAGPAVTRRAMVRGNAMPGEPPIVDVVRRPIGVVGENGVVRRIR